MFVTDDSRALVSPTRKPMHDPHTAQQARQFELHWQFPVQL
jgi:hypothetical protein